MVYIRNIQASWVTQGIEVAQMALDFGANDLGGTMIEENVVRAAGVPFHSKSIDEFIHTARKLGRPVAKRDTLYNIIERYLDNFLLLWPISFITMSKQT